MHCTYYGCKRALRGYRHLISLALEYIAGSSLEPQSRIIPYYPLLLSSIKPSTKSKREIKETHVLCDTSASISLAPVSITKKLGMRVDMSEKVSVHGADEEKISVLGMTYVYLRDKSRPSWRQVKVVVTKSGDNFLISNADLKNLVLLSKKSQNIWAIGATLI